jgi:hypothetical protein
MNPQRSAWGIIPHLNPIDTPVSGLEEEYWELHRLSASGRSTPEQEARLNRMCAEREAGE